MATYDRRRATMVHEYWRELTLRVALSPAHPAYRTFIEAWNELTEMEQDLVGRIPLRVFD